MPDGHRSSWSAMMALFIAAPTLMAAVGLCGVEAYRSLHQESPLFALPAPASLAEAILRDDVEGAYAFISGGQDPNRPIEVRDPVLTGGRLVHVSPLLLAVAARNDKAVGMLLGFGARMESRASCLADALDDEAIARILGLSGQGVDRSKCPGPGETTRPPLLAFAAD